MNIQTKTKLIWSVTRSGLEAFGPDAIAHTIVEHNINAVRITYTSQDKPAIKALRESLRNNLRAQKNQPTEGYIPFLFQLVGRRSVLFVPQKEIEVADGDQIDIEGRVSLSCCISGAIAPSPLLSMRFSHPDQMINLKPGSRFSFSYGAVEATILSVQQPSSDHVIYRCKIDFGGTLSTGMKVASSCMPVDFFPLLPEDERTFADPDFAFLADYVIVGGMQSEDEFLQVKKHILKEEMVYSKRHPSVPITKKVLQRESSLPPRFLLSIDSSRSLELLPRVLPLVDGVFLNRSDLGQTEHPHHLPMVQRELIAQCNALSKTTIIASELMHSMSKQANPTRAEVSDMANASADGADALAFSHTITEGPYANTVAKVSVETLVDAEAWMEEKWAPFHMDQIPSEDDAVTYGAMRIAEQAHAKAIVCFTEGGYTAMKLSSLKAPMKIIAVTFNTKVMRQISLLRSVQCALLDANFQMEEILQETKSILVNNFHYKKGDRFVFVSLSSSSVSIRNSNLFTLQEID